MPYAHDGSADITLSAQHLGAEPVFVRYDAISIKLLGSGTPGIAQLQFSSPLSEPQNVTHVSVTLPNGLVVAGPIVLGEQAAGGGWLNFKVDETDLGLL